MTTETVETVQYKSVQDITRGEYVKRKADAKKVYKRGAYLRSLGYELQDTEDINRVVYVKRGTRLVIGFTY